MARQPLPSDIYLDTSLIVSATISGLAHAGPCRRFCERLGLDGARVYFSQVAHIEFLNALRNLARPRKPKRRALPDALWNRFGLDQWTASDAIRDRWLEFGSRQFQVFLDQFAAALELPLRASTWTRTLAIMRQYDLTSYDALHVATALDSGVQDFGSADREFEVGLHLTLWLARDDRPSLV